MPALANYPEDLAKLFRKLVKSLRSRARPWLDRNRRNKRGRAEALSLRDMWAELFEEGAWA
ncbi:hypothetical protein [Castellaniella sp.]|uniref:hypothetical protein n=1 Tax=Castellaniella sp. TaxID=1955812 RepID=UPI002AFE0193|nr:hypothetical protein [Castellaniella sp.]